MESWEALIQGSFSVAVAAFLLLRMEKEIRALREAILTLRWCQNCRFSPLNVEYTMGKEGEKHEVKN